MALDDLINRLTDMDWAWWPVVSWRPAKNQAFTNLLVLKFSLFAMACCFPVYLLALRPLLRLVDALVVPPSNQLIDAKWVSAPWALGASVLSGALFFVAYKFTVARAWNRRAHRLSLASP